MINYVAESGRLELPRDFSPTVFKTVRLPIITTLHSGWFLTNRGQPP